MTLGISEENADLLEQALKTVRVLEQECRKYQAQLAKGRERLDNIIELAYEEAKRD